MNKENAIKSLNLTTGEVLTLEKAADRMEFEALPVFAAGSDKCFGINTGEDCKCNHGSYEDNHSCGNYCPSDVCNWKLGPIDVDPCDCVGPVGYIDCHPYRK